MCVHLELFSCTYDCEICWHMYHLQSRLSCGQSHTFTIYFTIIISFQSPLKQPFSLFYTNPWDLSAYQRVKTLSLNLYLTLRPTLVFWIVISSGHWIFTASSGIKDTIPTVKNVVWRWPHVIFNFKFQHPSCVTLGNLLTCSTLYICM